MWVAILSLGLMLSCLATGVAIIWAMWRVGNWIEGKTKLDYYQSLVVSGIMLVCLELYLGIVTLCMIRRSIGE